MQGKMPKPSVTVYTLTPASYTLSESFPATLEANSIVQLRPDVTGYLEAIRVTDGSHVQRGQVLYEIDKSRYLAAYNQANAALLQAQANLGQAERDYNRYQDLLKHDAIPSQVADQAGTTVKTAQANVAAAQAAVAKAGTDLAHAVVRSPMTGRIGIVQAKIGDIINAGQTILNTIVNDDPMYVDFNLLQSRLGEISGKELASKQFYLKMADSTQYPYPGKLIVINNVVDPSTGTVQVRLEFPNKTGLLKSGMNATVVIQHQTDNNTLAIPTRALVQTLSETSVFWVDPQNVVHTEQITTGPQVDSMTIIQKGISANQQIILDGIQKVRSGDTVNIIHNK